MDNRITIKDEDGNNIILSVLEATRINGMNYLLTTDAAEDEDGECYILKDISAPEDPEAVYSFVENDDELTYLFSIFTELMQDSDTELTR